jgi:16S rRNA (uracil1498-N3)-methyltransferase
MVHRLYCSALNEGRITLDAEESHHAVSVLRLDRGATVRLFDGRGGDGQGVIEHAGRRGLDVRVTRIERRARESRWRLTLAVAPPRAHRQGFLVEKATELGVAGLWPVSGERGVVRPSDGMLGKWRRRAIEALKQSGGAWLPELHSPATLRDVLAAASTHPVRLLADLDPQSPLLTTALDRTVADGRVRTNTGTEAIAFIGPEGGWTSEELALARAAGVVAVSLGPSVLRTETAALVVCAAFALHTPQVGTARGA